MSLLYINNKYKSQTIICDDIIRCTIYGAFGGCVKAELNNNYSIIYEIYSEKTDNILDLIYGINFDTIKLLCISLNFIKSYFKSITFVSPFFSFGKVKDITNNNDILKPNTINFISKKYKIDISKYVSNAKLPTNTKIIFGSKEIMKPNIISFSKIIGIQTVISLKNKIHGLPLWYLQDSKILSSLFALN
jgi:hypothetical protein